ncbi:MAG: hypothetical protein KAG19_03440 [Methylococcales bacterium]|nr:hypothetical protein [Methylococcales bacterium]
MSKTLRSSIGFLLLVTTITLVSCQSMLNVWSAKQGSQPVINTSATP